MKLTRCKNPSKSNPCPHMHTCMSDILTYTWYYCGNWTEKQGIKKHGCDPDSGKDQV